MTERGVRLVRGVDRREGEPFVPPSTAHGNAADGDRLEVRPETREPLGIRVTQNAGVVAGQDSDVRPSLVLCLDCLELLRPEIQARKGSGSWAFQP